MVNVSNFTKRAVVFVILPWTITARLSLDELDAKLLTVNGSSVQSLVNQFLKGWKPDEKPLLATEVTGQRELGMGYRSMDLFPRSCPLPGGGDCYPQDICCSSDSGAFCCGSTSPSCCGVQGDGYCCPQDSPCCGRGCCDGSQTCCGEVLGTGNCCNSDQVCCSQGGDVVSHG